MLLPAWGGAGKSTVVARYVLHGRGRFLADDDTVITEDGLAHLHLLPVHVYVHHVQQDPLLRQRLLAVLPLVFDAMVVALLAHGLDRAGQLADTYGFLHSYAHPAAQSSQRSLPPAMPDRAEWRAWCIQREWRGR